MKVVFRADASAGIGAGHVLRCATLARHLAAVGCSVQFLCRGLPPALHDVLAAQDLTVHALRQASAPAPGGPYRHSHWLSVSEAADAEECAAFLADDEADWIVVDHYALAAPWESRVRGERTRIAVIDDLADRPHDCDVLVDSNISNDTPARYRPHVPAHAICLFGARHAMLRPEFAAHRQERRSVPAVAQRIFVSFGGFDADNHTGLALKALALCRHSYEVDIILGAAAPHLEDVQVQVARQPRWTLHVQPGDIAGLMAKADMAVGAAGQMTYERACLGLPSLAFCVAENQRGQWQAAEAAGILVRAPYNHSDVTGLARAIDDLAGDADLRLRLATIAQALVDGEGIRRIAKALFAAQDMTVRRATPDDMMTVYGWRNDERSRRVSNSSAAIEAAGHEAWYRAKMADRDCLMLVAQSGGLDCGIVRFDVRGGVAQISIFAAPHFIGYGLGPRMLSSAMAAFAAERPDIGHFQAVVAEGHTVSQKLFGGAGFVRSGTQWTKNLGGQAG